MRTNEAVHYLTKKFRRYREDRGWSQERFAEYLSLRIGRPIRRDTVAQWENQIRAVNTDTAIAITEALHMPTGDLFERRDGKNNN